MKIVPASFSFMMDDENKLKMIGNRARICYRSEMKDDETGFVRNHLIGRGHNSTIEMAAVSMIYTAKFNEQWSYRMFPKGKFFEVDVFGEYDDHIDFLVTSTVRGWRELMFSNANSDIHSKDTWLFGTNILETLFDINPDLFYDLPKTVINEKDDCFRYFKDLQIGNNVPIEVVEDQDDQEYIDLYMRHKYQAVHIITNRAVTHEIVRHRICSLLQESQRYCRYSEDKFDNEVTFIDPRISFPIFHDLENFHAWELSLKTSENVYMNLLEKGASPQAARTVLPNSCKTEIIVYCSLHEWSHIFAMRTDPAAEPSMREITIPLLEEFKKLYPGMFETVRRSIGG